MKKQMVVAASLVLAGLIAGCGSSNSMPGASAISGKVADGYLVNATVFMDKNGNYRLDAGEPVTATDANGAYTLSVDPADVGKYPIVALAVQGVTVDKDTNSVVAKSYLLSMPKDSVSGTVSNFISPMSSQLREMMETGKYATMQEAMNALRSKLRMPAGTNMMADYVAGQNNAMHTAAQNMASLMAGQMSQLFGVNGGSQTSIDVNRYRGMMGALFSNMSSIKGQNAQLQMGNLMVNMTNQMQNIMPGLPFRNMSASFRMMGGTTRNSGGGMMDGTTAGSSSMTGGTTTRNMGGGMM